MATSPEDIIIKHLETLQSTINRMAQNSFVIKGWAITMVSVIAAILGTQNATKQQILIVLIPTAMFWALDAYYLRQERLYRKLYTAAAAGLRKQPIAPAVDVFTMDTRPYSGQVPGWFTTLFSKTVLPIPIVVGVIVVFLLATP